MTVCWLVVNTLLGVGMQVVAEAVALGSTLDLEWSKYSHALTEHGFL